MEKSTVSRWLNGEREPKNLTELVKLADSLDISLDELVGRDRERAKAMSRLRHMDKGMFRKARELFSYAVHLPDKDLAVLLDKAKAIHVEAMNLEQLDQNEFKQRLAISPGLKRDISDAPAVIKYLTADGIVRAEIRRDYCIIRQAFKEPSYWFEEWVE
ncbi:helix-turn-helix domain-containing protein [Endozoicomonas montiporae]|uniref:helix-turn-helix domain-containing protein n=1 Tax=Endozoicomonas montiporae TaxID=1027273 RepID=UPI000A97751E